jgi:hypothetical protein
LAINSTYAAIRDAYGRLAYSHKTRMKMVDRLNSRSNCLKISNIIALAITTGGLILPLAGLVPIQSASSIIATLAAIFAFVVSLLQLGFDPNTEIQSHRKSANELWFLKERYIHLIADLKDGAISEEEARIKRDQLASETCKVYAESPDTDPKSFKEARKALKTAEELTFSEEEIDNLLPVNLRESTPKVIKGT